MTGSTTSLRPVRSRLATDAAFTLTELMVVVVIVGVLSALATPYLARDRKAALGSEFASGITRELQRSRVQALAERLPVRAFVFKDRVDLRSWVQGTTPGAAPRAPTVTDPLLKSVKTKTGVDVYDVKATPTPAPAAAVLTSTSSVQIDFNTLGQAQMVGQPPLTSAYVFIKNSAVRTNHPDAYFRIDVRALTGYVSVRSGWP
jgi:prepilin-type N-terminal cleavage/methylation domain-containing protein